MMWTANPVRSTRTRSASGCPSAWRFRSSKVVGPSGNATSVTRQRSVKRRLKPSACSASDATASTASVLASESTSPLK